MRESSVEGRCTISTETANKADQYFMKEGLSYIDPNPSISQYLSRLGDCNEELIKTILVKKRAVKNARKLLEGFKNELRDLVFSLGQNIQIDSDLEDAANIEQTKIPEGIANHHNEKK